MAKKVKVLQTVRQWQTMLQVPAGQMEIKQNKLSRHMLYSLEWARKVWQPFEKSTTKKRSEGRWLKMKISFQACCCTAQVFFLCFQACGINHKAIHGIMNTKGGLWLFGNPLYQSPSFVKNEKWPGPNSSWINGPFPHNVRRGVVIAVMTLRYRKESVWNYRKHLTN